VQRAKLHGLYLATRDLRFWAGARDRAFALMKCGAYSLAAALLWIY
jgi:hypothetical protein